MKKQKQKESKKEMDCPHAIYYLIIFVNIGTSFVVGVSENAWGLALLSSAVMMILIKILHDEEK